MTDTTVTTVAPVTPLPNDAAARSPTGEILDQTPNQPRDPSLTTKTEDGKTLTEKTSESPQVVEPKSETDKPAEPGKVPDKYEFKAPEGYTIDQKLVDEVTPIFKAAGLTSEVAQQLMDFHAKQMIDAAKAPADTMTAMRTDWRAKVAADPEMSKATNGDKTGLDAVKLDIGRALTHLPADLQADFKAAMDLTGAGDHPAFVKAMWKFAGLLGEGKHVTGGGPSPAGQTKPGAADKPTAAKSLFPNLA